MKIWLFIYRKEFLVEMPTDERASMRVALLKNHKKTTSSRSIPVATMPSSKLAAMAANMKKESDNDMQSSTEIDDEISDNDNPPLVKLEDILIVPEIINDDQNAKNNEFNRVYKLKGRNKIDDDGSILMANDDVQCNASGTSETSKLSQENGKDDQNRASSSKDLSLSCVNSDANYRLEPT